jgi:hypothetical protein
VKAHPASWSLQIGASPLDRSGPLRTLPCFALDRQLLFLPGFVGLMACSCFRLPMFRSEEERFRDPSSSQPVGFVLPSLATELLKLKDFLALFRNITNIGRSRSFLPARLQPL